MRKHANDAKRQGKRKYPHIRVCVEVLDTEDELVLEYSFWLDDDVARNAFAARCPDAWRAGQAVVTYLDTTVKASGPAVVAHSAKEST